MRVGGPIKLKGSLLCSGSLRAGNKVEALKGINVSGSARIQGDVLTLERLLITGSTTINGNVTGTNISIGRERAIKRSAYKHNNKIYGNILARNTINIIGTLVDGDVKGKDVVIGRGTEVLGTVYFVNTISRHDKSILANKPVQIIEEDLHL
jgi:cytoskeletal protein CcmA (bactofilin family)